MRDVALCPTCRDVLRSREDRPDLPPECPRHGVVTVEKAQSVAGIWGEPGGLYDLIVDHPMWDGIDYSPEREHQIGEFLRQAETAIRARIVALLADPASDLLNHYAAYGAMTQECAHAFHDLIHDVVTPPEQATS